MKKTHLWLGLLGALVFCLNGLWMGWHIAVPHTPYSDGTQMMFRADHVYLFLASLLNVLLGIYYVPEKRGWRRVCQRIGSLMILSGPPLFLEAFCRDGGHVLLDVAQMNAAVLVALERPWTLLAASLCSTGSVLHLIAFAGRAPGLGAGFHENEGMQNALTVVTPVDMRPGNMEKLRKRLKRGPSFAGIPNLHMATLVVFDRDPGEAPDFKPFLVFSGYFDGPLESLLRPLWAEAGPWLESVYALCQDHPKGGFGDSEGLRDFFLAHCVPYNTLYSCYPGHSLGTIRENQRLREALGEAVDSGAIPPEDLDAWGRNLAPVPMEIPPISPIGRVLRPAVHHYKIVLPVLALGLLALLWLSPAARLVLGAFVALNALFLAAVAALEATETWGKATPTRVGRFPVLPQRHTGHNQMLLLLTVKPGPFRRLIFKGSLALFEFAARHYFDQGDFGGVSSIHFAHFTLLDGGRRMLFFSQFDGSREGYLFDFVERISEGLTFIGANTKDFPRSWLMFFGGARDEPVFHDWIHKYQAVAEVFYDAHEGHSSREILNDLQIRRGVDRGVTGKAARKTWLRRL